MQETLQRSWNHRQTHLPLEQNILEFYQTAICWTHQKGKKTTILNFISHPFSTPAHKMFCCSYSFNGWTYPLYQEWPSESWWNFCSVVSIPSLWYMLEVTLFKQDPCPMDRQLLLCLKLLPSKLQPLAKFLFSHMFLQLYFILIH